MADPLSRNPTLPTMQCHKDMFSQTSKGVIEKVKNGYILDTLFQSEGNVARLTYHEGLWKKDNLVVVPDMVSFRQKCIALHHDAPYAGHNNYLQILKARQIQTAIPLGQTTKFCPQLTRDSAADKCTMLSFLQISCEAMPCKKARGVCIAFMSLASQVCVCLHETGASHKPES